MTTAINMNEARQHMDVMVRPRCRREFEMFGVAVLDNPYRPRTEEHQIWNAELEKLGLLTREATQ